MDSSNRTSVLGGGILLRNKYFFFAFLLLMLIIGLSYAYWRIYLSSEIPNKVATTCFELELVDQDEINLENAYPITDAKGKSLTPYQFTITNKCGGTALYQINLEVLNTSTLTNMEYIKAMLDNEEPVLISSYTETTPVLSNVTKAYKIKTGSLGAKESKSYSLRLWMDYDTPAISEVIEKVLDLKVSVNASYSTYEPEFTGASEVIAGLVSKRDDLVYDEAGNIRYIGKDPNNYVKVDNELWRIIGVFNNIKSSATDEYGETRIKLIRNESIGGYAWDASTYNTGWGINEWSQADLMYLLNPGYTGINGSLYYNSGKGTCYSGQNNATVACDFTNTGLKSNLKNLIDSALWNTGSNGTAKLWNDITTQEFYTFERSNNTGKICTSGEYCNDPLGRTTSWVGLVGLMYPSDYGYATGGGNYKREYCLSKTLYTWDSSADCYNDDWLYTSVNHQWTLSPLAIADGSHVAFVVNSSGQVRGSSAANGWLVRPSVYLKSNVKILAGEGTIDNPYMLG